MGAVVVAGVTLGAASAAFAQSDPQGRESNPGAPSFTLGVGGSDWSGTFGAPTDTNIAAGLLTALYQTGDLRLSASVPVMRIESQGAVFAGVDGTPLIVAPSIAAGLKPVRDGVGDVTLGLAYLLTPDKSLGLDVDLYGRVKLPTATGSSELSTGEVDASFGAEVSRPIGRLAPFVSIGYRHFGDTPQWRLKDGFSTAVGATYVFPGGLAAQLSYDYAQRASAFIGDWQEIVTSVSAPLPHTPLRVTAFGGAGLTSGASDVSGGLSLSLRL